MFNWRQACASGIDEDVVYDFVRIRLIFFIFCCNTGFTVMAEASQVPCPLSCLLSNGTGRTFEHKECSQAACFCCLFHRRAPRDRSIQSFYIKLKKQSFPQLQCVFIFCKPGRNPGGLMCWVMLMAMSCEQAFSPLSATVLLRPHRCDLLVLFEAGRLSPVFLYPYSQQDLCAICFL